MEVDYEDILNEKELKLCRTHMNAKIDIFQNTNECVYRGKKTDVAFNGSYEQGIILNDAACILAAASNSLVYGMAERVEHLASVRRKMRRTFTQQEIGELNRSYVETEYKKLKLRITMKKLETDPEYISLCEAINHPNFERLMLTNIHFLRTILNHRHLNYHPKQEEIREKYGSSIEL